MILLTLFYSLLLSPTHSFNLVFLHVKCISASLLNHSKVYILPLQYPNSTPTLLVWLCSPGQHHKSACAYSHTKPPIFLPSFLPTLCSSHSVDLFCKNDLPCAWGKAPPRHHNIFVLFCCSVTSGRVFKAQTLFISPFLFPGMFLGFLQAWASSYSKDDVQPYTQTKQMLLMRKMLRSDSGSGGVLERALQGRAHFCV